jgi:RHS repeat-associated protein
VNCQFRLPRFSLTDPLRVVTQVSSSASRVRWSGSTGPFGDLHDSVAAPGDPYGSELLRYRFTGQYDAGFGLTHMRARNYNASLGAFTQTDPLQPTVGQAYPSTYIYANNNPLRFTDPSGLRSVGGHGDGRGVSGDPGPVVMLASLHQDFNIPGTNKCLLFPFGKTKCAPKKLSDSTKAKIDDLGTDFLETMAEAGGFQKSAKWLLRWTRSVIVCWNARKVRTLLNSGST